MAPKPRKGRLENFLFYTIKVILADRIIIGRLYGVDIHLNLILADAEETRTTRKGTEERRSLGLTIVRGDAIVSTSIEAPPPPPDARMKPVLGLST
ncbi:hypothetical protein RCL1_002050 [Eukaryota sp. TZLM3-RCL]